MPTLREWSNFYVIVGSSAGALIGLQFVVLTLIAERPSARAKEAGAAFATPSVVHFAVVLLLSAVMSAPWYTISPVAVFWAAVGIGGTVYAVVVAWRMKAQTAYRPVFEDWLFHVLLPFAAYLILTVSALLTISHVRLSLFLAGSATLVFLFVGIHNAWDGITWHVFVTKAGQEKESGKRKR